MRIPVVVLAAFCLAGGAQKKVDGPWAAGVPFEPIKTFGTLRIPNGPKPISRSVEFPAVREKPDTRVVLRFRSRVHSERPGGWNYYLGLNLNGKLVQGYTPNGTPRVVNRKPEITLDEGRPYTWPWWNRVGENRNSLLTFFGPGGSVLDKRIKSDRQELYWFIVDVTDLVNVRVVGLDDLVISDKPNKLELANSLLHKYVKGADYPIVLDDFAVGYLPVRVWRPRVGNFLSEVTALKNPKTVKGPGFEVKIGQSGTMHLIKDGQTFSVESRFSHPGEKVGWNALAPTPDADQHRAWRPRVSAQGDRATIAARCPSYRLERTVAIEADRVRIRDTFTNLAAEPVGILVQHALTTPKPCRQVLLGGVPDLGRENLPENPTLFLRGESANLGLLAEDNVLRLQMNAVAQPNRAVIKVEHFGLDKGASYTFEWVLYPFDLKADYWTFLNRVRKDWNINYTIQGPWDFFHVQRQAHLIKDPAALRAHLKRKHLKIVALVPWIDYENYDHETGGLVDRKKYKRLMTEAAAAFRAADPDVKVTGSMESFPISLSLENSLRLRDRLPKSQQKQGYPKVTRKMLQGLAQISERDKDALFISPEGHISCELYYRGTDTPMVALAAYPAVGNAQHDRLMEQARFIKEECGLDGIYIDCFSLAYGGNMAHLRYDYTKWDSHTVDVDPATGRVARKYTDAGLAGATSRAELIKYVLRNKGVFVANSYAAVRETQSLPAFRFSESEYCFDPLVRKRGEKPPLFYRMTGSQLATSIGLGYRPARLRPLDTDNYAQILVKTAITYLRYGGLVYHYNAQIPETGRGSGGYGPFNHMYPITPIELGEGFVIGRERIVTAVSRTFTRSQDRKPEVLVFDTTGRPIQSKADVRRTDRGWSVDLKIEDWENIAVIE